MSQPESSIATASSGNVPVGRRLDLLEDCADLQGQFPSNVKFKIVLWEHGDWNLDQQEGKNQRVANHFGSLALHLVDAEMVGMEVAYSRSEHSVRATYDEANARFVRGPLPQLRHVQDGLTPAILGIARGLKKLGRTKLPIFVPLDAFADSELSQKMWEADRTHNYNRSFLDEVRETANFDRLREGIVVRQLHSLAAQIAPDGQEHRIADVHGAKHSTIAVALRALGANVEAIRVSGAGPSPRHYLERLIRFQAIDAEQLEPYSSFAAAADRFGTSTWMAAIRTQRIEITHNATPRMDLAEQCGMLYLRGITGKLPQRLQEQFDGILAMPQGNMNSEERGKRVDAIMRLAALACRF